jgi:hypothetical protein
MCNISDLTPEMQLQNPPLFSSRECGLMMAICFKRNMYASYFSKYVLLADINIDYYLLRKMSGKV